MSVPTRLIAFAALLGLAFGGAALAGAALDPTDEKGAVAAGGGHGDETQPPGGEASHGASAAPGGEHASTGPSLSGLAISQDGFTLQADRTTFQQEGSKRLRFRIVDARGRVLRDEYEVESDRELHLVVVRRDTAIYEHVHPRKGADGTWSVDLELREPGVYRAFADFQVDGEKRALAMDLFVPGDFRPNPLPEPAPVADVDGFSVAVDFARALRAAQARTLTFSIERGSKPVTDLEPYLGARGHLVALREGDLGYLHVHPEEGGGANAVAFEATFPTAGRYRLFFQFQTGGRVRTVAYTIEVSR